MAREVQDREDLLRDATAFVNRLQLRARIGQQSVVVFAGFRSGDAASIYFDQDPVYHFNSQSQVRRAFVDGLLLKAENGCLASWTRRDDDTEVSMVHHKLTDDQQHAFCEKFWRYMADLQQAIRGGEYVIEGDVSDNENNKPIDRLAKFLKKLKTVKFADSPHVMK